MIIALPKEMQKKVTERARARGISEREYIRKAVEQALTSDSDLDEDMQAWDAISLQDFRAFAKKNKL